MLNRSIGRAKQKRNGLLVLFCFVLFFSYSLHASNPDWPELLNQYNVTWDSPGSDSSDSMPLGNGDVGLNVWVEQNGDLLFYLSKTDSWGDYGRLLKLTKVRIALDPNPFIENKPFQQTLKLIEGKIGILAGADASKVAIDVWADANRNVVNIRMQSKKEFDIQVSVEPWRTEPRAPLEWEGHSLFGLWGWPEPIIFQPDTILSKPEQILFCHRNKKSIYPRVLKNQHMESLLEKFDDPLINLTFGASIQSEQLDKKDDTTLISKKTSTDYLIRIYPLTAQTDTLEQWQQQLESHIKKVESVSLQRAWRDHQKWWHDFWQRSYIFISGSEEAEIVTRGYTLQRFINACGGRGKFPIKFNGSIFTVDPVTEPNKPLDADYRQWGSCYWFQNTRLPYWSMLMAGDYDLMQPLFKMYMDALPLATARTRVYYHHPGAFFPETMHFWGTNNDSDFGWNNPGFEPTNPYIRYYWSGSLELITMMLDYYDFTQDKAFLNQTLVPFAEKILDFYAHHYPTDANGLIRFEPAQALETWQKAVNPLPIVAGLRFVVPQLCELPGISKSLRNQWRQLQEKLPPIPIEEIDGQKKLVPGEIYEDRKNMENAELYAIFPYRHYGLTRPNIEIAKAAFEKRIFKGTGGWFQDSLMAALLGNMELAKEYVVKNFSTKHEHSRFPAFWGPNYDWIPDQDHGCVTMVALQRMLMQYDDEEILLLPAWPKEWDVTFKLHAPGQTTVQGVYQNGEITDLTVDPVARKKTLSKCQPK